MSWRVKAPRELKRVLETEFGPAYQKGWSIAVFGNEDHKMTMWYWLNRRTRAHDLYFQKVKEMTPKFARFFKPCSHRRAKA